MRLNRAGAVGRQALSWAALPVLHKYRRLAWRVPGWTDDQELVALARAGFVAPRGAVIVEVGTFFGRAAVVLAGARKLRGSGTVHCIDPFDASGDVFSVPHYREILAQHPERSQRDHFADTMRRAGLSNWVAVHEGTAAAVGADWNEPIDLLFLDGDQSPAGARAAYDAFAPWLKRGGVIALHNSKERTYDPEHDGHYRLVREELTLPAYVDVMVTSSTTFARKAAG